MDLREPYLSRFLAKIDRTGECWIWCGYKIGSGYGRTTASFRKMDSVHRIAYELFIGQIPDGMEIDHTCHNGSGCRGGNSCPHRSCVNPDHLEAVPRSVNILRGESPAARNARTTQCPQRHPYEEANVGTIKTGGRRCLRCAAERQAARRANETPLERETRLSNLRLYARERYWREKTTAS